jgi:DNA (cytosine-5)-methyltransferase 1
MKIIDLFAGCGGMSLGFEAAGFEVVGASEIDLWASDTYRANHPDAHLATGDIRQLADLDVLAGTGKFARLDGVVGGPPCQGFSLSGNRDPKDPRSSLFMDFVRVLRHFKPRFFVMENVTGLLSMKTAQRARVIDIILSECASAGFKATYAVLNAANFGVPQRRERVFIIGISSEYPYNHRKLFPQATVRPGEFVTVEMAISDLPQINAGEGEEEQLYASEPRNKYQEQMRQNASFVYNHVAMRHTQRLVERFKVIQYGQSVAHVSHEHSAHKRGDPTVKSGKVFGQNNMRVFPDQPSPTVPASFQSNFIHPFLDRNFTAREGARLQSFPDRYRFRGKRTTMSWEKHLSQYQQIGNAVPPLLAQAIAKQIAAYCDGIEAHEDDFGQSTSLSQQLEFFTA